MSFNVYRFDLETAQPSFKQFTTPGSMFQITEAPGAANLLVKIGDNPDYIEVEKGLKYATMKSFSHLFFKWSAVPGGELRFWVGDEDEIDLAGIIKQGVTIADGDLESIGSLADNPEYNPDAASATLMQALRALVGNTGSRGGIPFIATVDCPVPGTAVSIDVNAALGSNAQRGSIRAKSANTGVGQFRVSPDNGVTWSDWYSELLGGEVYTLDEIDVDRIEVKSSVAGDDFIYEGH